MNSSMTFDDLDNGGTIKWRQPFFEVNHTVDSELLDWLKQEFEHIGIETQTLLDKVKNNYLRYKGIQYLNQVYEPRDVPETRKRYMPQMVVPLIRDSVDEKVSRITEFKPAVAVLPTHDEERDKVDAKVAKTFLTHVDYTQDMDVKFKTLVRDSKIAGEAYFWIRWNPDIGEDLPEGSMIGIPVKQGDVEIINMTRMDVRYQLQRKFKDVDYFFVIEYEYTDALKREYPDKANDINVDSTVQYFDFNKLEDKNLEGKTRKITFYHRRTKFVPEGYECCFTRDVILKKGPLSYKHGMCPIIRLVDGENPEELFGESYIEHVKAMAAQYNNMTNMIIKQQMLAAHPKWFVEAGSLDEQLLNNDTTIVKIKGGARPPVLAQGAPVSQQVFDFREKLREEFYQMAKSNSVIRGEPPPGVTAFVAMQYLSESESRRLNSDMITYQSCVRSTYKMILDVVGQFYKDTDKRTQLYLGYNNVWEVKNVDVQSLSKSYNIMIQNASALPDSKALRTQALIDLNGAFPDMFPREQVVEMMGFSQSDKFVDEASKASRCAEAENEAMMDNGKYIEPEEGELHIVHWRIHTTAIQDFNFKMNAPKNVKDALKDHILATEQLMIEQAARSPQFAQQLQLLSQFPMFLASPQIQGGI